MIGHAICNGYLRASLKRCAKLDSVLTSLEAYWLHDLWIQGVGVEDGVGIGVGTDLTTTPSEISLFGQATNPACSTSASTGELPVGSQEESFWSSPSDAKPRDEIREPERDAESNAVAERRKSARAANRAFTTSAMPGDELGQRQLCCENN